ncbi:GGDEF domain-containing protein [Afifella sp. H1R]|uniref:GGDEF domain-containing protein n=1 Tax=unclassified Afifella TaxID=2624128 RepID=UPI001F3F7A58|nr:GGDEF domain-containing protein [Afifella sp. H1R]MCF1504576.1 GGDEF domain-containing protein [Afifella sp. H1R]
MQLDLTTISVVSAFCAAICSVFLMLARCQYPEAKFVWWWIASNLAFVVASLLLAHCHDHGLLHPISFAMMTFHPALIWASTRMNGAHFVTSLVIFAGPAFVTLAAFAATEGRLLMSGTAHAFVGSAYLFVTAYSMISHPAQPKVPARWPLAGLCVLHALALAFLLPVLSRLSDAPPSTVHAVAEMLQFEALLFILGSTIFVTAAMRERREACQRVKAETDELTGILNRRGFLERAERTLKRCRKDGTPCAVALFDLDYFKEINDTYGHAMGDNALKAFIKTAQRSMRANDLFGRVGGEEFAALFPGADAPAALSLADRVRQSWVRVGREIDGRDVNSTMSGGVVALRDDQSLEELLALADQGLYLAKKAGRNRIELAANDKPAPPTSQTCLA